MTATSVSLDALFALLELPPRALQAFDPERPQFSAARPLLVLPDEFDWAREVLATRLPSDHAARAVVGEEVVTTTVDALPDDVSAWLVEPAPPESDLASIEGLRGVMERLFGPDGCPWDREQTHESLSKYFLEEAYEAVDAIDRGDLDGLREELGDVLAHIFMQTALAQQSGAFTAEDVADAAARKMVRRHPCQQRRGDSRRCLQLGPSRHARPHARTGPARARATRGRCGHDRAPRGAFGGSGRGRRALLDAARGKAGCAAVERHGTSTSVSCGCGGGVAPGLDGLCRRAESGPGIARPLARVTVENQAPC